MTAILLTVFLAPLVWSGLVYVLRIAFNRNTAPDDSDEKLSLAIILVPVAIGLVLAVAAHFKPIHLPAMPHIALAPAAPADLPAHVAASQLPAQVLDLSQWLVPALLALYAGVAAVKTVPLLLAFARLRRMVNLARLREVAGEAVYVTAGDMPPLAWGRDIILLPESLTLRLSRDELALVIRHEREHLHRGDPTWFAMLAWIDAIFWFNPFVRLQTGRCRIAAELSCDAAVTRAAPAMREVYASLLVETLKHAAGDVRQYAPAVISTLQSGDYRMRLKEIMHAGPLTRKPKPWLYALMAATALPLAAAQFAWSQDASIQNDNIEPIVALADGTVTKVTYITATDPMAIMTANGRKDATTVDIDHGDGITSEFLTPGKSSLAVGAHVTAGQKLAEDGFPVKVSAQSCRPQTPGTDPVCGVRLMADNGRAVDSQNDVMWGHVRAEVRGHVIYADIAFENATTTVDFQDHVRIDWTPAAATYKVVPDGH